MRSAILLERKLICIHNLICLMHTMGLRTDYLCTLSLCALVSLTKKIGPATILGLAIKYPPTAFVLSGHSIMAKEDLHGGLPF